MTKPEIFTRDLLESRSAVKWLAELAIEAKFNPASAESPDDLILRLLPSDGHLD